MNFYGDIKDPEGLKKETFSFLIVFFCVLLFVMLLGVLKNEIFNSANDVKSDSLEATQSSSKLQ